MRFNQLPGVVAVLPPGDGGLVKSTPDMSDAAAASQLASSDGCIWVACSSGFAHSQMHLGPDVLLHVINLADTTLPSI